MKPASSIALAMGVGFLLGGQHKVRSALLAGGAAATGQLGRGVAHGAERAGVGMLGRLGNAGTAAARTALSKPIESLGARLNESAESLRHGMQSAQH
jgi:hypothetical protein